MKLIIFDMSGVLTNEEEAPFVIRIAEENSLPVEEFRIRYDELIKKAEISEITGEDVWNTLMKEYNFNMDIGRIEKEMVPMKYFFSGVLDLVKELKKKYKVVFFTNYNKFYWDLILKSLDFSIFDKGFVSYELKTRKPSHEGFKIILKEMNCDAKDALFIDDSEKNVNSAIELGIKGIHLKNPKDLRKELQSFLN